MKNTLNYGEEDRIYNINDYFSIINPRIEATDVSYNGISRIITVNKEKTKKLHSIKNTIALALSSDTHLAFSYLPISISFCKRKTIRLSYRNLAGFTLTSACNIYKYCPLCNATFIVSFYELLMKISYTFKNIKLITLTGIPFKSFDYIPDHKYRYKDQIKPEHILWSLYHKIYKKISDTYIIAIKPSLYGRNSLSGGRFLDFFILLFNPYIEDDIIIVDKFKEILSFSGKKYGLSIYDVDSSFLEVFDVFSFLAYRIQPELTLNYGIKIHPLIFSSPGLYCRGLELPIPKFLDKRKMNKFLDNMYLK